MASDSDLQAYLNQLTKTTKKLQAEEKEEVGEDEKDFTESDIQIPTPESPENLVKYKLNEAKTKSIQKNKDTRSNTGSKLSRLEEKYLKRRQHKHFSSEEDISNISSVDQNLKEIKSALEYQKDLESSHDIDNKVSAPSEDEKSSKDSSGFMNINNLMTVDDILGQITESSSDPKIDLHMYELPDSEKNESNSSSVPEEVPGEKPKDKKVSQILLKQNLDSLFHSRKKSLPEINKNLSKSLLKPNEDSIFHSNKNHPKEQGVNSTDNLLKKKFDSPFHSKNSSKKMNDSGLHLLVKYNDSPFSGGRKSKSTKNESEDLDSNRTQTEINDQLFSDEDIEDSIEDLEVDKLEDNSNQENSTRKQKENFSHGKSMKEQKEKSLKSKPTKEYKYQKIDESSEDTESEDENKMKNKSPAESPVLPRRKESKNNKKKKDISNKIKKSMLKRSVQTSSSTDEEKRNYKIISKNKKYITIKIPRKEFRYSTTTEDSTSSSDEVVFIPFHSKHHGKRKSKKKKKKIYMPWMMPDPRFQPPPPIFNTQMQPAYNYAPEPVQRVDDALRITVDLTRQFMESQQSLYHAYLSTIMSDHKYSSIKETEDYIRKNKKPPMSFKQAYREVLQEEQRKNKS